MAWYVNYALGRITGLIITVKTMPPNIHDQTNNFQPDVVILDGQCPMSDYAGYLIIVLKP